MPVEHDTSKANVGSGGGGGGGGGSFPDFSGSGDPSGVVTAAQGSSYVDTTNGALYFRTIGSGSINTGWVAVGGANPSSGPPTGVMMDGSSSGTILILCDPSAGGNANVIIADTVTEANGCALFNGIYYDASTTDGQQNVNIYLGNTDQFQWAYNASGSWWVPDMPSTSNASNPARTPATTTISSGTGKQFDTEHDRNVFISTSTAGTVALAISPDNVTYSTLGTRSVAANDIVQAYVPSNWYLKATATTAVLGTVTYY